MDAAYPQWRKIHKAIPRPHDLADSFFKLIEACNDITCSTSQWISRLDNCGWLSAIQSALHASCVTALCLHQEVAAVLVHGVYSVICYSKRYVVLIAILANDNICCTFEQEALEEIPL